MSLLTSYPGVYIQEIPSSTRTVVGEGTTVTAFIGRAMRGPVNEPVRISNFGEYERIFGGLAINSPLSYAVSHYFLNGGSAAVIVRVINPNGATRAARAFAASASTNGVTSLTLEAANQGEWGNSLYVRIDHDTSNPSDVRLFNLIVTLKDGAGAAVDQEFLPNLSLDPNSPRFFAAILPSISDFIRTTGSRPNARPDVLSTDTPLMLGAEPNVPTYQQYIGVQSDRSGIYALEKIDSFDLLCIPPAARGANIDIQVWQAALSFCRRRRAILLLDAPVQWAGVASVTDAQTGIDGANTLGGYTGFASLRDENAALFFPGVYAPDPLRGGAIDLFMPSGAVAGAISRIDAARGIWSSPAGTDARLAGIQGAAFAYNDAEIGQLNPLGVNVLRPMPGAGVVIWGARTMKGADRVASDWKYLAIRRLTLYIERSIERGIQWAVFRSNDASLWGELRMNIGSFMQQLFRQGAFQGAVPGDAYFVKCDGETTTRDDVSRGVVNVMIGFAPSRPAEFVVIRIQQIIGQGGLL